MQRNIESFRKGLIDGIPIALGYFAVSFTLGIRGGDVGLKWYQSALMSATNYTSAGQAAALSILEEGGSYIELIISTLVINLRYLLMSAALTIKLSPQEKTSMRMLMGIGVTDEIFGISVSQRTPISPLYNLGAMSVACPGWVLGTALGGIMGEILPPVVTASLSIALYAMFLAIIGQGEQGGCCIGASFSPTQLPLYKDFFFIGNIYRNESHYSHHSTLCSGSLLLSYRRR